MALFPSVGDLAPPFEGATQDGGTFRLQDYRGAWVVLYFYPKDRTRHCTIESCGFRDEHSALEALGAIVVGVSRDTRESHEGFARRHGLRFPLVADPHARILSAYGVKAWYGLARRVTFLIDPAGRVARIWRPVGVHGHAQEVREEIRQRGAEAGRSSYVEVSSAPDDR